MADTRKSILKEISQWKKRLNVSKRVLSSAYKDISKDAKKAYKDVIK